MADGIRTECLRAVPSDPCRCGRHGLCSGVVGVTDRVGDIILSGSVVLRPCGCMMRTCPCRLRSDSDLRSLLDDVERTVRDRARRLGV